MAHTSTTTKLVATAIATFVSTDKFIIFPSIMAATPSPRFDSSFFTSLRITARLWMPERRGQSPRRLRPLAKKTEIRGQRSVATATSSDGEEDRGQRSVATATSSDGEEDRDQRSEVGADKLQSRN